MVNEENVAERLRDARSILRFAEDSYRYVLRIYELVQSNGEFFNASVGADNLELATLKLETLVDQWRCDKASANADSLT